MGIGGTNIFNVLKNNKSFICADLQSPTNINYLAELKSMGVNIYLHMKRIHKKVEKFSSSPGLLHTKMFLIDELDDYAELVIGSHNWTEFSLFGLNIEGSIHFKLYKRAPLYARAEASLEYIRNECEEFDLNQVNRYKELQNYLAKESFINIIELEGYGVDKLNSQVVCIFGNENDNFEKLSQVGKEVFISIQDSINPKNRYLYESEVIHAGRLPSYDTSASGINITEPRRYAFTDKGRHFPELKREQIIKDDIYKRAYFFASMKIKHLVSNDYDLLDISEATKYLWVEPKEKIFDEAFSSEIYKFKKDISSLVLVPFDDKKAKTRESGLEPYQINDLSLEDKRKDPKYNLISKKIIRKS